MDAEFNEFHFTVTESDDKVRIDKYLPNKLSDLSRNHVQKMLEEGLILVNQNIVKANYIIKENDNIDVYIKPSEEIAIEPEDIPLDILYEDDDLLVVNKPKNMVVHPAAGHENGTLVNAVLFHCKGSLSGINGEIRPGIVHRIDKDTTGSLIVCKNDFSHQKIAEEIARHDTKRVYVGIVINPIKDLEGTIDAPIGRSDKDRKKMAINRKNGKNAVTHYRVIENYSRYSYVEFRLETGRTHQIRVHMASIGHPLLGDEVYGPKKCPYKLQGQSLHAKTIGFVHPRTGEYIEVDAPLPEYFEDLLRKIKT